MQGNKVKHRNYFVIRNHAGSREWLWNELKGGMLRQGWGIPGMHLKEKDGAPIAQEVWEKRYIEASSKFWMEKPSGKETKGRFRILSRMLEIKKDDLIVLPKMPERENFSLVAAAGNYRFDFSETKKDNDFGHVIPIDTDSVRTYHYSSSPTSKIVAKKMRAYQSAVNNVRNEQFLNAVNELMLTESDQTSKETIEIYNEIRAPIIKTMLNRIRDLPWVDLEELVKKVFESAGYDYQRTHLYDSKGGDADIVFSVSLPLITEFDERDLVIYIQVKQKEGIWDNDTEGVDQLIKVSEEDENCIKIYAATVDDFTDNCKRKAHANGVILIAGMDLARMFLKHLH